MPTSSRHRHRRSRSKSRSRSPILHHRYQRIKKPDSSKHKHERIKEKEPADKDKSLAPLKLTEDPVAEITEDPKLGDFIHAPAKNMTKISKEQKMKEKLSIQRERRETQEKLRKVKGILDDSSTGNTMTWIEHMRLKEKRKREYEAQSKHFEEFEEEIVTDSNHTSDYTSDKLEGFKVDHDIDRFQEGKTVIMTLKDKEILQEDDDALVNVNIMDEERYDKNKDNKRKKDGLAGILADIDDEYILGTKNRSVLGKYDAEIDEPKQAGFVLNRGGSYMAEHERAMKQLQAELKIGVQSVAENSLKIANEYYTEEEMKFKKRKKKTKVLKRRVTAGDFVAEADTPMDHGSRKKHKKVTEEEDKKVSSKPEIDKETGLNIKIADVLTVTTTDDKKEEVDSDEEWAAMQRLSDDEPDLMHRELEKSLAQVRQAKIAIVKKPEEIAAEILEDNANNHVKSEPMDDLPSTSADSQTVVFDYTAEFYKSISNRFRGDSADTKSKIKKEPESDNESLTDIKINPEDLQSSGDENEPESSDMKKNGNSNINVLNDEPKLGSGIFSALQYAQKKGYFHSDNKKKEVNEVGQTVQVIQAKNIVQEDRGQDSFEAKFAKRERYNGPLSDFKEMEDYKPDVRLDYIDEFGRQLSQKEAFRMLSHKFHGRGSGKKKTEKKLKKIQEENLLNTAASTDTPLGTAEKLTKRLERDHMPYVVLSGSNSAVRNLSK